MKLALAMVAVSTVAAAQPVAEKKHTEKSYPGGTLVDDYAWLRERTSPAVLKYLEAENAYAEAQFKPLQPLADALNKETLGHIKQTDDSVPYLSNGYTYVTHQVEGKQYYVVSRRKGDGPEEVLLDGNAMAVGEKFFAIGAFTVSPDNTLLAYTTDTVGFRQYKLHVKDLRTGTLLPDTAERVTSLAWGGDNKTLVFTSEDAKTKRSNLVHRHTLGTRDDLVSWDEKDERFSVGVSATRDRRYLILSIESHTTSEARFVPAATPAAAWKMIEPRKDTVEYSVDEADDVFYLRINDTAKMFRVVTAPVARPGKWTELIKARADVPLDDFDIFKSFYVLTENRQGLRVLTIVPRAGGAGQAIAFPEPAYAASGSANPEYDTPAFRYTYQSPITPPSTFDYDVATKTSKLLKRTEVPHYDPTKYAVVRLTPKVTDGTAVPVTVTYRKDLFRKGGNPLFVYGYGSYGFGIPDGFDAQKIALLDRGLITSVAHIRGGNELGDVWHDGGKMMTKRNTFTDFIDATKALLAAGYGQAGRVGIQGGSAGGLLMGAVTNMAPELFKVVLCEVPFVDVMNTMLDASLPETVEEYEEWGNPNEVAAFKYMRSYSPYDNIEAKAYPAILVQTSFDDSQVMYWEPAKYTAKLRALKTDKNPLLFFINMHGGHGGSSGRYDRVAERARNFAFMLNQLGITK